MTIFIVQMTQISNIKVIGLMVYFFKKIVKLWYLSIEFYGEWQLTIELIVVRGCSQTGLCHV